MPTPTSFVRRASRWAVPAGLLIGLLALMAAPAEAAQHHVMIEQYSYGPSNLSIAQGDTVTWTNHDSVEHDVVVTSGPESFRSPLLSKGESWSHTFTTPGTYSYICSLHPDMRAGVTAAAPAPTTTAAAPTPTQQVAPSAPASPRSSQPQATGPTAKRTPSPKATSAVPSTTTTVAQPTPLPETTKASLNPLLLVAGASTAVVVFCLLLMASRPVVRSAASSSPEEES